MPVTVYISIVIDLAHLTVGNLVAVVIAIYILLRGNWVEFADKASF